MYQVPQKAIYYFCCWKAKSRVEKSLIYFWIINKIIVFLSWCAPFLSSPWIFSRKMSGLFKKTGQYVSILPVKVNSAIYPLTHTRINQSISAVCTCLKARTPKHWNNRTQEKRTPEHWNTPEYRNTRTPKHAGIPEYPATPKLSETLQNIEKKWL